MRAFACALAASLLLAAAARAAPARAVSLNLCTDELLLLLADPGQIASVTHLARDPAESRLWRAARRYPGNDGSLLSAMPARPDLVLTMGGGPRDGARIAARLGVRMLVLPFSTSIADVETSVRTVAAALGQPRRGERLLARMAKLRRTAPPASIDTIWLSGGGRSIAADGLSAQWLALAGLRQRVLPGARIELEELVARPPSVLLRSGYRAGQFSGEQRWMSHPLARTPRNGRTIVTDGRPWLCAGPGVIDEVLRLRETAR